MAQVSRSPKQAQLRRFLRGCDVTALDEGRAHRTGALLAKSRTRDVVDACVVALAVERTADIVSDDTQDLRRLMAAARGAITIRRV